MADGPDPEAFSAPGQEPFFIHDTGGEITKALKLNLKLFPRQLLIDVNLDGQ